MKQFKCAWCYKAVDQYGNYYIVDGRECCTLQCAEDYKKAFISSLEFRLERAKMMEIKEVAVV